MAGRRIKPCEFCEDETASEYIEHRNGYCLWLEIYPFNGYISAICQANDEIGEMIEDSIEIPMNYCPKCGRKLMEG